MARSPGFLSRFGEEAALAIAVLVSLILMATGSHAASGLVGRVIAATFNPPRVLIGWFEEGRALRAAHDDLVGELVRLRIDLMRSQELTGENQRLRQVLDFCEESAAPMIATRVVARQGSPWSGDLTMIVDKGRSSGLQVGMAVLTPAGLVGRVAIANDYSSAIEPLFSRSLAVSAYDLRSRVVGIAHWTDGVLIGVEKVPLHCDMAVGDTLVTSGLGGGYPRGIGIGVLKKVEAFDYDLFLRIEFEPFVDFQRLEEMLVVLWHDPAEVDQVFQEINQTLIPVAAP